MSEAYSDLPRRVTLHEEGPREGFQSEAGFVPTEHKVRLIEALAETGLRDICCTSFVNAKLVPQMADAEAVAAGIRRLPGVRYGGLWLSEKGFDRARAAGVDLVTVVFSAASATMARHNNGVSGDALVAQQMRLVDRYRAAGLSLDMLHVSTAFGCAFEGEVTPARALVTVDTMLRACSDHGLAPRTVYLSDTVGAANPVSVQRLVGMVREQWPEQNFALHLHDTRGTGLANVLAGLQMGIAQFDTSIAGLGGCPFAGNTSAAGNVSTEDVALMCEEMGIATGLDFEALAECARLAEGIVGRPLPGKAMKAGRLRAKLP